MRGIRTKEDAPFEKYFSMFQEEVAKRGFVYFIDHAEVKEVSFQDMVCTDMHGWLLPEGLADEFEPIFMKDTEEQWKYGPFVYVDFEIKDDKLSFIIEELEPIDDFYAKAKRYCEFLAESEITRRLVPEVIDKLMVLYVSAQMLLDMSIAAESSAAPVVLNPEDIRLGEDIDPIYWQIHNPYVEEEPVCGHIVDDLVGIANDLLKGMAEYESGRIENAVFEWKLSLRTHWGCHLVDVLIALHQIRPDEI